MRLAPFPYGMGYHGIQTLGISVILYGLVTAFVESTWTGSTFFTPTGQSTAGIGIVFAFAGAFLDPVVGKWIDRRLVDKRPALT
jgi:hypothetical protein